MTGRLEVTGMVSQVTLQNPLHTDEEAYKWGI